MNLADLSFPEAPKIVAKPPGPKSIEVLKKVNQYVPHHVYERRSGVPTIVKSTKGWVNTPYIFQAITSPIVWDTGRGATIRDVDGNIFIDFSAGWHAASTGHSHPKVVQAVKEVIDNLVNTDSWSFELQAVAAKKFVEIAPKGLNKTFFQCSGTEAVEQACKLARFVTKKTEIISLHYHYHGSGYLASSLTGFPQVRDFGPYPAGVLHAPTPYCYRCSFKQEYPKCDFLCLDYVDEVIKAESPKNMAAVILEPWSRHGGTPEGYLARLKEICEENNILLIADEITCGFGRTGKWWACDWEGVVPDILCSAKGLSSGFPASAVIASAEMMDQLPSGCQASSFGMGPISCAAVSATIDVMKEMKLVENAAVVGNYVKKRLLEMKEDHKLIGNVVSKGLEPMLELVKDRKTKEPAIEETKKVFTKALEKGLLTYETGWWTPPLVLTRKLAEKGLDILEESISEVEREL